MAVMITQTMGKRPKSPPRTAEDSAIPVGKPMPKTAMRSATTSATAPEVCARALRPNSMMKNAMSGSVDTSAVSPTLPAMASVVIVNVDITLTFQVDSRRRPKSRHLECGTTCFGRARVAKGKSI